MRMGSSDVGVGKRGADGDGWMDVFVYTRRGIVREVRDGFLLRERFDDEGVAGGEGTVLVVVMGFTRRYSTRRQGWVCTLPWRESYSIFALNYSPSKSTLWLSASSAKGPHPKDMTINAWILACSFFPPDDLLATA